MDLVISHLDQKYSEFLAAIEKHSLPKISRAVYEYFDIIQGQKTIQKILETNRQEIATKKVIVNSGTSSTQDSRDEIIRRIDRNSLSYSHDLIYNKMYAPMKAYKESTDHDDEKVLTGMSLLFQNGSISEKLMGTWDQFKLYCALDDLIIWMERIHATLVKKLLEIEKPEPVIAFDAPAKIRIMIDDRKGIYQAGKEQAAYGVEKGSKRMKLIQRLISKDNCGIAELEEITHQSTSVTIKAMKSINELFRENLHLTDDLILSLKTGGYSLNKDIFDISISPNL
jgi:hypothetical protein